jgi:dihydroflavonol-4-reductase
VAQVSGYFMEKWADRTGNPPLTTAKEVPYAAQYLFYDVKKARERLGLKLSPIEDSLKRAIAWFRQEGYIRK